MHNLSRKILGFSLAEILIVIVIVGIITAIAVPSYKKYILRAKYMEGVTLLQDCMKKMQVDYLSNGGYPPEKVCGMTLGETIPWNINHSSVKAMTYQFHSGKVLLLKIVFMESVVPTPTGDLYIGGMYSTTSNRFVTLCGKWNDASFSGGDASLLPASCNNPSISTNILGM
jgi:prepilin-type N-terminal cleavage/methylation domain-containing protein